MWLRPYPKVDRPTPPRTYPPLWGDGFIRDVFSEIGEDDREVITCYSDDPRSLSEYTRGAYHNSRERLSVYVPGRGAPKTIEVADILSIIMYSNTNLFGGFYISQNKSPGGENSYPNYGEATRFRIYPSRRVREWLATYEGPHGGWLDESNVVPGTRYIMRNPARFFLSIMLEPTLNPDDTSMVWARLGAGMADLKIPLLDIRPDDPILATLLSEKQLDALRAAWR